MENPRKREEMLPENTALDNDGVNNDSNKVAPQRGYKHSYATLDQEIALALLPINFTETVSVRALRAAEHIIEEDREDFKRWSAALRTTEQILKYDRPSVFGVIQNAPAKDTYHFPESLRRHIDSWLKMVSSSVLVLMRREPANCLRQSAASTSKVSAILTILNGLKQIPNLRYQTSAMECSLLII